MRYYYDCRITSEFMAKYHNFIFEAYEDDPPLNWEQSEDWPYRDRYYIRPDSLHILERQEMDLMWSQYFYDGELQKEGFARIGKDKKFEMPWGSMIWNKEICQVIQRNGLPFMWPKIEEADNG